MSLTNKLVHVYPHCGRLLTPLQHNIYFLINHSGKWAFNSKNEQFLFFKCTYSSVKYATYIHTTNLQHTALITSRQKYGKSLYKKVSFQNQLKTLRQKEKLLSNFFFCHNVFKCHLLHRRQKALA